MISDLLCSEHTPFDNMINAEKNAHAQELIRNMPADHHTNIGESGSNLSVDQGQRFAIAHAMLKDSPILLLDEAATVLDSESERLIQDVLALLVRGCSKAT